ncbi:MAG TPA: hypothetical protein VFZ26_09405 [Gemmatimonadales bacterium]
MAGHSRSLELSGVVLLAAVLAGCGGDRTGGGDAAFAEVQARGESAMGVDQYTSSHVFESLPDGGRIVLQRDVADSAGTEVIRAHMRHIASAFARGDFALPGFVHAREVPGTAVMTDRRDAITYTADTLPRGGQLRIRTSDPEAVRAIHQFLAFQRADHRAAGHAHDTGAAGPDLR